MAAGAPERTNEGSLLVIFPSAGLRVQITEFLYWTEASLSPQSQKKKKNAWNFYFK